jgi:AcrR family transcriptional regulator
MGRRKRIEDQELLAIARDVFVKDGFGASTRAIAHLAGVSEAILFQRFRTKPELFFAAMVPPAPDIHAILVSRMSSEEPSLRLEEIALRVLAYFREITPVLLPLIAHPEFNYESFTERYPDSPLNQLVAGLQAWLRGLESKGTVALGEADTVAITVVSSMASLAIFEKMGVHGREFDDDLIRQMARLIWRGGTQSVSPTLEACQRSSRASDP